jgi:spore coat protein H
MNSDRVKKITLGLSVILAMILFYCLYLINLKIENTDNNREVKKVEAVSSTSLENKVLKENKNIYNRYNPDEFMGLYISVFSTEDKDGEVYDFSDFDLIADWNKGFNPVLNANVQFSSRGKQFKGKPLNIPNASIRVRGNPGASLKSYRIKLMDGTEGFNGQSTYNINKNMNDPSRIANKLAHDLIINLKHISGFRTSFFELYIKDNSLINSETDFNSYGLYTHIEQPNKSYLKSRGLDENGSIYRAEDFYFQLAQQLKNVDDPDYDEQSFETVLAIREGNDHTKLINMLKDINDESKDFEEAFHKYFNEDNYLTWLSINILLGNADAMSGGFLLYNPSDSYVFYLLPWDFDGIFQWMQEEGDEPNIYDSLNNVALHRRYLQQDKNIEKLKERMEDIKNKEFTPSKVKSLIKLYKPVLLEMMDQYPDNVLLSMPLNEQIAYLGQIDEKIIMNYNEFIKQYD